MAWEGFPCANPLLRQPLFQGHPFPEMTRGFRCLVSAVDFLLDFLGPFSLEKKRRKKSTEKSTKKSTIFKGPFWPKSTQGNFCLDPFRNFWIPGRVRSRICIRSGIAATAVHSASVVSVLMGLWTPGAWPLGQTGDVYQLDQDSYPEGQRHINYLEDCTIGDETSDTKLLRK